MRKVPLPSINDEVTYDRISDAKNIRCKRSLKRIRKKVFPAYLTYVSVAPSVDGITPVKTTALQRSSLIHAYESATAPMKELRRELTDPVVLAVCPFCGIGESSTLDHYLPKELYPEFSIFSKNLVPSCGSCNTRKSTLVVDKDTSVRCFLHPYYDVIPKSRFVSLDLVIGKDAIALRYKMVHPSGMSSQVFDHLSSHFKRLQIADRCRKMSLFHLRDRRKAFARFFSKGGAARVSLELNDDAADLEEESGPNHWQALLYRSLADSKEFCDGGFTVLNQIQ